MSQTGTGATPDGTQRYAGARFSRLGAEAFAEFGKTGWVVSVTGFGGYRVHVDMDEHVDALRTALRKGINLIDTSTNYADGGSERLVGKVLGELLAARELIRNEVVVVSKVGYIQGSNLALAREREAAGTPFPEMVKYSDDCWHCLHPDFLEDQLTRSLERLGLETIDVYLLHNPEYFLMEAAAHGLADPLALQDAYYARIGAAFAWLEAQVAAGRIACYGVSSNTLVEPLTDPAFTSLERLLATAREAVGEANHFRVIQFPFNLMEAGACTEPNNCEGAHTVLSLAREANLATLANRPLNAASGTGAMVRLASFDPPEIRSPAETIDSAYAALQGMQREYEADVLPALTAAGIEADMSQAFHQINRLGSSYTRYVGWLHWEHSRSYDIEPAVAGAIYRIERQAKSIPVWRTWSRLYRDAALNLLEAADDYQTIIAGKAADKLVAKLDAIEPELAKGHNLQQRCLRLYRSVPGLHSVLLGMRQRSYVMDALHAARRSRLDDAEAVIAMFNNPPVR